MGSIIKQEMRDWFLKNYEDPVENTPVDGGEYVYIWGEPNSAATWLYSKYGGLVPDAEIEALAGELEDETGTIDWVPVPVNEDEEE